MVGQGEQKASSKARVLQGAGWHLFFGHLGRDGGGLGPLLPAPPRPARRTPQLRGLEAWRQADGSHS